MFLYGRYREAHPERSLAKYKTFYGIIRIFGYVNSCLASCGVSLQNKYLLIFSFLGEAMVDRTLVKEDLINLAISLITTLFFHRGIQFNPTLAYRTMAILVSLTNYLKLVLKMPAYMATMGFLMQLAQQYENSMDSSLLNV